jgi:signal transduction histidine kinase
MVAHGQADATVQNLAAASRAIRLDGLTNLKISGVTRYEFPLRFAVRKDAPELASILNKALATVTPDEQETIYAAHLTPDIGKARDWGMWRRRALYAAALGTGVAVLLLLWNTALKHQIRSRKKAEADLNHARKTLEGRSRELAERVKQVERLNEEMRAANYDLESFSLSVSHDLRGPLRRMSSFAELLQKQAGVFLSKPHSEWLALVVRESKHMDLIIHDLLEFARLGRRELRRQRVNMNQLVKSALEDFEPQLRQRQITWNVGALPDVFGDLNLLRLAFSNLLDNALKYTRQRPHAIIEINTKLAPPNSTVLTFYIKDNGTGFDMKQSKKIFEPFERLPQEGEFEGVGIGLANVKKIIQKHGGEIWCDAIPDEGATFYFTLPISPVAETGLLNGETKPDSREASDR